MGLINKHISSYFSSHFLLASLLNMICLCIFSSTEAATLWIFIVQPRHVYNYSTIRRPLTRSVTFIAVIVRSSNFTVQQAAVSCLWQIDFGLTGEMYRLCILPTAAVPLHFAFAPKVCVMTYQRSEISV